MPTQANGDNLYIGTGKFYFDRFDAAGNSTGLRFVGEVDKGDVTPKVTVKDRFTTTKRTNNKIASIPTQQEYTLSVDLMEWTPENIALAFFGDTAVLSQAMSTIVAETLSPANVQVNSGAIYSTLKRNISAAILKTVPPTGEPVVLVLGTDYEIENAAAGLIRILADEETFPLANSLTLDYTAGVMSGTKVAAGTTLVITGRMLFVGDPISGPFTIHDLHRVRITSGSAISLLSTDFATMTMTGDVLDDSANNPDSPFFDITYPS